MIRFSKAAWRSDLQDGIREPDRVVGPDIRLLGRSVQGGERRLEARSGQIALVETCATLAVIAMENVRQFRALADRTAEMAELCRQWKPLGHRLGFGVGISTGYATVGPVGHEGRSDHAASGTAINVAARPCELAEDGEILLSGRASIAVADNHLRQAAGDAVLKGTREPVEVFRLTVPGAES